MTDLPQPESTEDPLARASDRLDQAVQSVSRRIQTLEAQLSDAQHTVVATRDSDEDRAKLAASLDEARAREAELNDAVQQATEALDDAMGDIRAVLGLEEDQA